LITIEWDRINGGIGTVTCINNNPETKKILFGIKWNNYEELGWNENEKIILSYNSRELKNFNLLNRDNILLNSPDDNSDIDILEKKMERAVQEEEYEKAANLQKLILNLKK
jgi:excinuclease UvrABC helicase subunit UvrB